MNIQKDLFVITIFLITIYNYFCSQYEYTFIISKLLLLFSAIFFPLIYIKHNSVLIKKAQYSFARNYSINCYGTTIAFMLLLFMTIHLFIIGMCYNSHYRSKLFVIFISLNSCTIVNVKLFCDKLYVNQYYSPNTHFDIINNTGINSIVLCFLQNIYCYNISLTVDIMNVLSLLLVGITTFYYYVYIFTYEETNEENLLLVDSII
jgi:hypothetical protein